MIYLPPLGVDKGQQKDVHDMTIKTVAITDPFNNSSMSAIDAVHHLSGLMPNKNTRADEAFQLASEYCLNLAGRRAKTNSCQVTAAFSTIRCQLQNDWRKLRVAEAFKVLEQWANKAVQD